ncbi:MAG: hypothetical protein JNK82_29910 [Myxococcaceae bacterium]|nr:hypothetical protein [Myxococcaceae bacterium]
MIRLKNATALCYRIFDVAEEIDLKRAAGMLSQSVSRMTFTREGSEYVQLSNPPLSVELGTRPLALRDGKIDVQVAARLFDHGALSVILRVPIPAGTSLEDLIPFADELYDSPAIERVSSEVVAQLRAALGPAFKAPHLWEKNESYTVLLAKDLEGASTPAEILGAPELARLLIGEVKEKQLSPEETQIVIERSFSYGARDLAVVDWNAAFLWEPSGSYDIADLLEVANAQLFELRYYDDVLDRELTRIYDAIESKKTAGALIFSPYKKLMRELMLTVIELTEYSERVENSIRIVGDVYLARVYEAAVVQLRIGPWQSQVTRKLRLLNQTYELLKGEVDTARSLTLEVMIVLLIVFEVVMALVKVGGH